MAYLDVTGELEAAAAAAAEASRADVHAATEASDRTGRPRSPYAPLLYDEQLAGAGDGTYIFVLVAADTPLDVRYGTGRTHTLLATAATAGTRPHAALLLRAVAAGMVSRSFQYVFAAGELRLQGRRIVRVVLHQGGTYGARLRALAPRHPPTESESLVHAVLAGQTGCGLDCPVTWGDATVGQVEGLE